MLRWTDDRTCFTARGTEFITLGHEGSFTRSMAAVTGLTSSPRCFVLLKTTESIERYVQTLRSLTPRRIVELGIFQGGSTALLMELAHPNMLVAIEREPEPSYALESFLRQGGFGDSCRTVYGVDQADRKALSRIVDTTFGTELLDLVIDDASHLGPQTRASFETLFPRLRPDGLYILEDWSWHLQGLDLPGEPMERFVSELLTAAGRGPGLIASIKFVWDVIVIRRGAAPVDGDTFSITEWFERMV